MLKTRSMGRRKTAVESLAGISAAARASSLRSWSSPAPVFELTATMGDFAGSRNDPRTNSAASIFTTSSVSGSTRSDLVRTVIPRGRASMRQMSKCSRVCGLMPSSAAIIRSTRSMPPTPASMLRTKRSWPGTSTNPMRICSPEGLVKSRFAKPISMVMPRLFSSSRRSGSVPVKARTSALLPWSMWPAVPTITAFMRSVYPDSWNSRNPDTECFLGEAMRK